MSFTFFFDFDGVIVNSIDIFSAASTVAAKNLGYVITFEADDLSSIKQMRISKLVAAVGVAEHLTEPFIRNLDDELYRRALELPLFPGMADVIEGAKQLGNVAIVSASTQPVISKVLANHNVEQYIDDIVGGDTPGAKSNKISTLIEKYQGSVNTACMIGDTISDIEQSKRAQVFSIAVSWGWHRTDWLSAAEPDFLVHSTSELTSLITYLTSLKNHHDFCRNELNKLEWQ